MYGIFDTHCHLNEENYEISDFDEILSEARLNKVSHICNVGYNLKTSLDAISCALEYENVYAAIGIHPNDINAHKEEDLKQISQLAQNKFVVAIGEIGLDYYRKNTNHQKQKEWFIKQIKIALKYSLPVIIHVRDAFDDVYEIVKEYKVKGIIHCFSSDFAMAQKFIDLGFYISFAGNITFKNATSLQEVAKLLDLQYIVIETDSPYLTPHPYRGLKNYPKNIVFTAKKIAELKKIDLKDVINATRNNALKVFNIKENVD